MDAARPGRGRIARRVLAARLLHVRDPGRVRAGRLLGSRQRDDADGRRRRPRQRRPGKPHQSCGVFVRADRHRLLCADSLGSSAARWRCIVIKAVQFVTLLLFSLVTGVFWGTWFSLSRSMPQITPGTFLEVGRLMIANLGGPMSVLMPAALLSALVLCVWLVRHRQGSAALFAGAALILMAVALAITLAVNVPIDRQIQSWTTATLPSDWQAIRDRWEFYHGSRTLVSLAALACLFASTPPWPASSGSAFDGRQV